MGLGELFKRGDSQVVAHQVKHVFVTGGVISGLGKGLTASSLGLLLKTYGYKVTMQKFDPYLNPDPGTMSPYEHGEVFVTDDGGETDLDLGNYERFIDVNLPKLASATTGQVYQHVLNKERKGEYLGKTIQVIPHITDEIKCRMRAQEVLQPDVIITEIGGTVGDIESQPFLEAARQIRHELGYGNVFFVHCSLVPFIKASGEMKTKPTQHSVMSLRSVGIQPNALILRSELPITDETRQKVGLMCDVSDEAIVNCIDVPSIYAVPPMIKNSNLINYIIEVLHLDKCKTPELNQQIWGAWENLMANVNNSGEAVVIAIVGKYISLHDSYLSVSEAIKAAAYSKQLQPVIKWIDADLCETPDSAKAALEGVDGIIIPGGFGERGVLGKIGALRHAREYKVPLLGICLGLQCMVIEYARNVLQLQDANSTEFNANAATPVVTTMAEQIEIVSGAGDMGGTMRLGLYDAALETGTLAHQLYSSERVQERHRHRYEVNNKYRQALENAGLKVSGTSLGRSESVLGGVNNELVNGQETADKQLVSDQHAVGLVEFIELPQNIHPYYIATQAHPEFLSRPTRPHPLFKGLVQAAANYSSTNSNKYGGVQ
jgi:CTP synthase